MRINGKVQGLAETSSAISSLPSILVQAGQSAMTEVLELLSKTVRNDFLQGPYPEEIERRSGSFRATFARGNRDNIFQVRAEGTRILGTFGSNDRRARILNEGGTIRPTHSQFLAIRSDFTKTAGGVVRAKYQQPLRNLPNTFVRPIRGRRAKAAVFERIGRRVIPIAWLVSFVTIVGRKFMQKTEAKAGPQIGPIFERRFSMVITRLNQTLARLRGR